MTGPAAVIRRRLRETRSGDADGGISLVEVMVSMVLMSIFMSMFFGGILSVFKSMYRTQSSGVAQTQINLTFLRLDRQIRYAAAISTGGVMSGDPVIEYLTTSTGTPTCTQLRLDGGSHQLKSRTWQQGANPLVPTPWIPLANQVTATSPFTFIPAGSTLNFQQLRIRLSATDGTGTGSRTRTTDLTFTALNSTLDSDSTGVCTEGRAVP